jgi:cyclase
MLRRRLIPVLLLRNKGLVKGVKFKNHKYIGDPINTVKLFNAKEADELVIIDIEATNSGNKIDYGLISDIVSEAFMPIAYGGGINSLTHIEKILKLGIEKVVIGSEAFINPQLISDASYIVGAQSIVVSVDIKKNILGKNKVYIRNGSVYTNMSPIEYAKKMESLGAGELIVNFIDNDGKGLGYELETLKLMQKELTIPIIGSCGAGSINHFVEVFNNSSVNALAAGDFFVFQGIHKAVLITYPNYNDIQKEVY